MRDKNSPSQTRRHRARPADLASPPGAAATANAQENLIHLSERRAARQNRTASSAKQEVRYKRTFDYTIIVLLTMLICLGLVMVYSASYYTAELRASAGTAEFYFGKQLLCVGLGAVCMIALMFFDYHNFVELPWERHPALTPLKRVRPYWVIMILAVLCLGLVFVPGIGQTVNGSSRWINVAGISIQPSELVKVGLIIFLSCSIGRDPRRIKQPVSGFLPYLLLLLVVCIIMYKQPNFSAIMCICMLVMALLLVGGARLNHMGITVAVAAVALIFLVTQAGYREDRLDAMSDPMSAYQVRQSLIAIGSGGLFGRGLGNSMQKYMYLPYSESDCIFAIIAEELGLVGATLVLVAFGLLIWRGVVTAMRAPDLTGMLMASGVVATLVIQVVINIGVVVNLVPPTGVILPFVSYGGSAVIIFMAMMGILLNVSRQAKRPIPAGERGELNVQTREKTARKLRAKKEWGA